MAETSSLYEFEQLESWLSENSRGAGDLRLCSLAFRAAARVLPLFWKFTLTADQSTLLSNFLGKSSPNDEALTALPMLRLLVSDIAAIHNPSDELVEVTNGLKSSPINLGVSAATQATSSNLTQSERLARRSSASAFAASTKTASAIGDASKLVFWTARAVEASCDALGSMKPDPWRIVREERAAFDSGQDLLRLPLWLGSTNTLLTTWREIKSADTGPSWSFWIDWYQALLDGRPQKWQLLEQIALIDPNVWDAGPHAVALQIEVYQRIFSLKEQAEHLGQTLSAHHVNAASAAQRSHNDPPELVDDVNAISAGVTLIWDEVQQAADELDKPCPDPSRLRRIGEAILSAVVILGRYVGSLAGDGLRAGAKAAGAAVGVGAAGALIVSVSEIPEPATSFAHALKELAELMIKAGLGG